VRKVKKLFLDREFLFVSRAGRRAGFMFCLSFLLMVLSLWFTGCCELRIPLEEQISENITPFLNQVPFPLDPDLQSKFYSDFLVHYYSPWQLDGLDVPYAKATWAEQYYTKKNIYAENRLPLKKECFEAWIHNANFGAFNTLKRHAIVIYPSSLRVFPTIHPMFYTPSLAGEGFPFDYNQNSTIKAFTPLIVSHLSRDGGWAFAQSPFALGWIKMRDLAFINEEQIHQLVQLPKAVLLKEHMPVYGERKTFLFYAKMATLFPETGREKGFYKILVPESCGENLAFQERSLSSSWVRRMPIAMNKENIGRVSTALLGEMYGWGGLLGDRDCSSMTRDFFAPFGIYLPRNSRDQASVGKVIDLSRYEPREKEKVILERGVPFRTLLYLPGHIMLYIGKKNGKAYVMHNMWGIHTKGNGRIIVGRTVITDLYLGKTLPCVDSGTLLVSRITSMNIVTQW